MMYTEVITYGAAEQWAALKVVEFLARTDRGYRDPHQFTPAWTQAVISNA